MNRDYTFGVVVLTMGKRKRKLDRALGSVLAQRGVDLDIVVVFNGKRPPARRLPPEVRTLHLAENVGIPAGRNAGVREVTGEFLLFLDDDSWLLDVGFLAECARRLRATPGLGMVQPRIVDPERRGDEPTRWIPRIRKGNPRSSSVAFSVAETVLVLRRAVFDATGGWPEPFFYAHEGIELAWRIWDTGYRVEYHGDLEVGHPVVDPARHDEYLRLNARNRVWLARRCLPWPFSWTYVLSWTAVQVARTRDSAELSTWFSGWRRGWREEPWPRGQRPPRVSWGTIARMTRHGRPPVI